MISEIRGLPGIIFSELNHQLHYDECCSHHKLASGPMPALAKILAGLCYQIWLQKGMPGFTDKALLSAYAESLTTALYEGFGGDLTKFRYDSPDYNMLTDLRTNVYQFSAAKTYCHMKALTEALVEDDKVRSFSQFKKAAYSINEQFAKSWLKTEYNSAIAGGQMASKWVDILSNPATKYLQFDAVMDGRTTELCSSLHGVIKPVNDDFWNTYYPPNHFNCRSTVKQLMNGRVTPDNEIVHPEKMPAAFKTNMAKTGVIFPKDSPYYTGMPNEVLKDANKQQYNEIKVWAFKKLASKTYPIKNVGEVSFSKNYIKKIINGGHKNKLARNQCLFRIQDVMKEAVLVSVAPNHKVNPQVSKYYYAKFILNGEPSFLNVREHINGKKYLYAITDKIK